MNQLIKKEIEEFFEKEYENFAKHTIWEEDGKKFSSWEFRIPKTEHTKGYVIRTGDGGAELMMKELIKQENELTK